DLQRAHQLRPQRHDDHEVDDRRKLHRRQNDQDQPLTTPAFAGRFLRSLAQHREFHFASWALMGKLSYAMARRGLGQAVRRNGSPALAKRQYDKTPVHEIRIIASSPACAISPHDAIADSGRRAACLADITRGLTAASWWP